MIVRNLFGVHAAQSKGQPHEQRGYDGVMTAAALGFGTSAAGVNVTPSSAMSSTAVLAAVRVLSESIASLPLVVYRMDGRNKERAPEHPLYRILHDQANPEMTAFNVRRLQVAHMAMYGNSYCEIQWSPSGQVEALWPLHPSSVGIERDGQGQLQYTYWTERGGGIVLPAYRVLHLRWLDSDGVVGQSPIMLASGAVGLSMAMEKFGGAYFANGARPSVILKHPQRLKPDTFARLRETFASGWSGLSNAYRIQILEDGMDVTTVGVPPEEAQLLDGRRFQVTEIARMFRVPPHLVGDLDRATFSNIEQQGIEFLQYTLTPMIQSIEQELRRQLMRPGELDTYDVEHIVDGFLRGDSATRYAVYVQAINNAIMSVNEVRALENLNPIEGGDTYYMPLNLAPLGERPDGADGQQPGQAPADQLEPDADEQGGPDDGDPDDMTRSALQPLIADAQRRVAARVVNDVRQGGAKALRQGGRLALSEWGETQIHDWRMAGESMLAATNAAAAALGLELDADVGAWVAAAYQDAIRGLIDGD